MVALGLFWPCLFVPYARREVPTFRTVSLAVGAAPAAPDQDLRVAIRECIAEAATAESSFDVQAWDDSVELVAQVMSSETSVAERVLAEATRWLSWARAGILARKYIKPDTVRREQIQASMEWLRTGPLAWSDEQITEAVRSHPHLYLLNPEEAYRKVLGVAPRQYRDVDVIKSMLLEDPSILQFQYNCDNDCISECGSCWVTLQNRL